MNLKCINVIIITTVLLLCGCENNLKKSQKMDKIEHENLVSKIENFTLTKTKQGKVLWEIVAKQALMDEQNSTIVINQGELKISNGNIFVANVIFEQAKYNTETGNILLPGKNIITTVENEKIITYDINYIYKENKICSDKEIIINKNNNVAKGIGFETLDGFQTIRIYKNVITTE